MSTKPSTSTNPTELSMPRNVSRRSFVFNTATLLAGAAGASKTAAGSGPPVGRETDAWIPSEALLDRLPRIMGLASVPGVSIAVVEAGAVVWTRSFGVRDAGGGGAVEEGTVFEAASLSKPLVAYVALMLHHEGKLDLDRPLIESDALSDLGSDALLRKVTARNLLSHSSGLPNWRRNPGEIAPAFEPGSGFSYSGEGYVWLQRTLEQVSGRPFGALMRERLLSRLGLTTTSFVRMPEHEALAAVGHSYRGNPVEGFGMRIAKRLHALAREWKRPIDDWRYEDAKRAASEIEPSRPPVPDNIVPNAASSLVTTGPEYARFLAHLLTPAPTSGPGLPQGVRAAMMSPQVTVSGPLAWGLGWGLEEQETARWLWHWGDNGSFKAFAVADPESRRGLVVFTNGSGGRKVYERIVRDAVGSDPASFLWV